MTFESLDPRTGERTATDITAASDADVDAAVRAAAAAGPALVSAGLAGRSRLLRAIADELTNDGDAVVAAAVRESGLPEARLRGELQRTTGQLNLFAEVLEDGGYLEITIDPAEGARPDLRRMLVPVGPVGVFSASNFPLAFSVAGGDTASALASGCPVVVKAHPGHPETSELAAAAVRRGAVAAGLPADILRVVHGLPAGPALVKHPLIQAVGFTGSVAGGRFLYDLACARPEPIPFFGELGSLNPLVVTPAAAAERAEAIGEGLAGSFTLGMGQFCTKPGLVFVPAGEDGARLVATLKEHAGAVTAAPMLSPRIQEAFLAGAAERLARSGAPVAEPAVVAARVVVVPASELDEVYLEECFGPLTVVAEYHSEQELFASLEQLPGSLTATIHTGAHEDGADTVASQVAALAIATSGRLVFNGFPTGVAVSWAMHHGGPYPAATFSGHTSVGATAIRRFLRPVCYQDAPEALLPEELRSANPLRLPRRVNGKYELND